jgi:hypothetical protein
MTWPMKVGRSVMSVMAPAILTAPTVGNVTAGASNMNSDPSDSDWDCRPGGLCTICNPRDDV